jgi:hypothetical protein
MSSFFPALPYAINTQRVNSNFQNLKFSPFIFDVFLDVLDTSGILKISRCWKESNLFFF